MSGFVDRLAMTRVVMKTRCITTHERFREPTMNLTPIDNPAARPEPHPICLLVPSADEDELQNLTEDIRAHARISPAFRCGFP